MNALRTHLTAACVVSMVVCGTVRSAPPAPAAGAPPAESVLKLIPAGSLGYLVINNVKATTDRVDKFIVDIGVPQLQQMKPDQGPAAAINVLPMIRGVAQLGEGFNPNGGLAVAVLDPKALGLDLVKEFGLKGRDTATAPAGQPDPAKMPIVAFVAGSGVKEVFGAWQPVEEGKFFKLKRPDMPFALLAAKRGGYVLLSPMAKALEAALAATKGADQELAKEEATLVRTADIAIRVNMKTATPLYKEFMAVMHDRIEAARKQTARPGIGVSFLPVMMGLQEEAQKLAIETLEQMEASTFTARLVKTGVVFDILQVFKPDTRLAKVLAAARPATRSLVGRLPNLPYVAAMGSAGSSETADKESKKMLFKLIDQVFADETVAAKLPPDTGKKVKKIFEGMVDQVTGMQVVGGGAPAGSGLFGLVAVIECRDAAAVKRLLADTAATVEQTVKSIDPNDRDLQGLGIAYVKGVETAGGVSVDAVAVTFPDLQKLSDRERLEMNKALGEDKIRILVAAADRKTVVVTFGGSVAFMEEALKAARSKTGSIRLDAHGPVPMMYMPKNLQTLMLFNARNLYEVMIRGMKVMSPESDPPPFQIAGKVPVMIGGGVSGRAQHAVVYVPTQLVKDGTGMFGAFFMRPRRAGRAGPPGMLVPGLAPGP